MLEPILEAHKYWYNLRYLVPYQLFFTLPDIIFGVYLNKDVVTVLTFFKKHYNQNIYYNPNI